jgi:DNA-binding transcriptional MerR regulator
MSINKNPAFNLKAVLQETGIAADTLRAWERRYGLPLPQRSAGGHRLYSKHDIETIKWLMARQAEGLSISRAVDLWNEKIASGSDPLSSLQTENTEKPFGMSLETTRKEWLAACLRFDTLAAEQILNQAFAAHSVEIAATEVILRGLYEIGDLWYQGKASVQQEHFASGIATRRVDALISGTPAPSRTGIVLLACPPGEWHSFPLLLLNLFLRRRGWNVVQLGANVPTEQIDETIRVIRPNLVILSAQTLGTAVELSEMARILNKRHVQTAFGGRVFNFVSGLHTVIPAHFLGETIELSIPVIERLIDERVPMPAERETAGKILQAASAFEQGRARIEMALEEQLKSRSQVIEYLDTAIRFLGDALTAALQLGDISYLEVDIAWLIPLLAEYHVSPGILPIFLGAYAGAVREVLGDDGRMITAWLEDEARKLKV